jgi:hypothetical protein
MVTTATVLYSAVEHVWGVAGSLWSVCVRGGVNERTRMTGHVRALARLGTSACMLWRVLGVLGACSEQCVRLLGQRQVQACSVECGEFI